MSNSKRTIISLGSHCEPALQYRRFFSVEPSSPFDWLITYPLSTVIEIFNDDGARFGDEITIAMQGTSAKCNSYGCFYHHEFEKNNENQLIISSLALKNCKEKLLHKYNKMIHIAKNSSPVFVRWIHNGEVPQNSSTFFFLADEINDLYNTIVKKISHDDIHIAIVASADNKYEILQTSGLLNPEKISVHIYESGDQLKEISFWDSFFNAFISVSIE